MQLRWIQQMARGKCEEGYRTAGILLLLLALWMPIRLHAAVGEKKTESISNTAARLELRYNRIEAAGFPQIVSYVTVSNDSGYTVGALNENHFIVKEDGVRELPIQVEELTDSAGVSVILMIDRSTSMSGQPIIDARNAAITFVNLMNSQDRAALVSFANEVRTDLAFTRDKTQLIGAIQNIQAKGGTAIFDALIHAASLIQPNQERTAIILLTDGEDRDSRNTLQNALDAVAPLGVPVYTIGLRLGPDTKEGQVLQQIAAATAGRYYYSPGSGDLEAIYRAISALLHHAYRITYTTHNPAHDGALRHVNIAVNFDAQTASDTASYRAPFDEVVLALSTDEVPAPNRSFTINLEIPNDSNPVYRMQKLHFRLRYDPQYVKLREPADDAVIVGSLFGDEDEVSLSSGVVHVSGMLDITLEKRSGTSPIDGRGWLAGFVFEADENLPDAQRLDFRLEDVQAWNADGLPIPNQTRDLTVAAYGWVTFALGADEPLRPGRPFHLKFEIPADGKALPGMQTMSFILQYDPTFLTVREPYSNSLLAGALFGGAGEFEISQSVDAANGLITMNLKRKDGLEMVQGRGRLAEIVFDVDWQMPDSTYQQFQIINFLATDSTGWQIPAQVQGYEDYSNGLTVWPGDTNENGAVELSDVNLLGVYWGLRGPGRTDEPDPLAWRPQYSPRYPHRHAEPVDADGNGVIDERDLIPIGMNWAKTVSTASQQPLARRIGAQRTQGAGAVTANLQTTEETGRYRIVLQYSGPSLDWRGLTFRWRYPQESLQILRLRAGGAWQATPLQLVQDDPQRGLLAAGLMLPGTVGRLQSQQTLLEIEADTEAEALARTKFEYISLVDAKGRILDLPVEETWKSTSANLPHKVEVQPAYPNPFNPSTRMPYFLPQAAEVHIRVFDAAGRLIFEKTLRHASAGSYEFSWDGRDFRGRSVASGIYFARFAARLSDGTRFQTRQKWTLLK